MGKKQAVQISSFIVVPILLWACSSIEHTDPKSQSITGQWIYSADDYQQLSQSQPNIDWQKRLSDSIQQCEETALESPIKKPKCKNATPVRNCQAFGKTVGGDFCYKPINYKSCSITEVQSYRAKLKRIYHGCMAEQGWEFQPINEQEQPLQPIINTIPELVQWQQNDWEKWKLVAQFDAQFAQLPEYKNIPTRERLLAVVDKVKQHTTR